MNSTIKKQIEQEKTAVPNEIDIFKAELYSIQAKLLDLCRMAHISFTDVEHEALKEYLNTIKVELELTMEKNKSVLLEIGKQ